MVQVAEQAEQMENVWDENLAFGKFYEDAEEATKDNSGFYKGLAIGAGAGVAVGGGVFGGLWIAERRKNKELFEVLEQVIEIGTFIYDNPKAETMKWKKEDIDLTKMTLNNQTDLQLILKDRIENMKWVSKKWKENRYKDLKNLSELSVKWKEKEQLKKAKAKINATEDLEATEEAVED